MDLYKEYCIQVYSKHIYSERYINKLIDDFEKGEYHITFVDKKLSLPMRQYRAYKLIMIEFNRYDFLYLDLSENPPHAYHKFSKKIAEGDKFFFDENGVELPEELS